MKKILNYFLLIPIIFLNLSNTLLADGGKEKVQIIDLDTVRKLISDVETKIQFIEIEIGDQRDQQDLTKQFETKAENYCLASNICFSVGSLALSAVPVLRAAQLGRACIAVEEQALTQARLILNGESIPVGAPGAIKLMVDYAYLSKAKYFNELLALGIPTSVLFAGVSVHRFSSGDYSDINIITEDRMAYLNLQLEDDNNENNLRIAGNEGDHALLVVTRDEELAEKSDDIKLKYNDIEEEAEWRLDKKLAKQPLRFWTLGGDHYHLAKMQNDFGPTVQLNLHKMEKSELKTLLNELKIVKRLLEKSLNGGLEQPLNLDPKSVDEYYRKQALEEELKKYKEKQEDSEAKGVKQEENK